MNEIVHNIPTALTPAGYLATFQDSTLTVEWPDGDKPPLVIDGLAQMPDGFTLLLVALALDHCDQSYRAGSNAAYDAITERLTELNDKYSEGLDGL